MNKRGMEEIVGFVLIVVLIAVVGLVFLGLMIKPGSSQKNSREVENFLSSILEYTSPCAVGFEPDYSKIGDLIAECGEGSLCTSGDSACKVLNETVKGILDKSWNTGKDAYYKGYKFTASGSSNVSSYTILEITKGNCSLNVKGAKYPYPNGVSVEFSLCT